MGKKLNLLNQTFGYLTVIQELEKRNSSGGVMWLCKCKCGKEIEVSSSDLRSGHTSSCGCYIKSQEYYNKRGQGKILDLTNQKFGKLTPLYRFVDNNHKNKWHCLCDCGNECDVQVAQLTTGKTRSCGCLKNTQKPLQDLANQKFGKLIAIEPTEERKNKSVVWKCQCECGNICYVTRAHLIAGYTNSCGCLKNSVGEYKIACILKDLNIPFEQQKTFSDCLFPDTNYHAYFDFFINNSVLLEYDGEQHFIPKQNFGGQEEFEIRQKHDLFKTEWCKQKNIPLIRITYKELNQINKKFLERKLEECQNIVDI